MFLGGEKQKCTEKSELGDNNNNINNIAVEQLLEKYKACYENKLLDSFGIYLLAILYRESNEIELAKDMLCESLNLFPYNWSGWIDLADLCKCEKDIELLKLKDHWIKRLFLVYCCSHLQLVF